MTRLGLRGALLGVLLLWSCAPSGRSPASAPATRGLDQPARIVTDRWGIPHLRAASLPDLYFAWGYVTARERLWQLVSQRQAADGELWRWLGNRTLRADAGAQLFELRARAEAAWVSACRDSAAAMPLERFAAGVNAYMARCRSGAAHWPAELEALGVKPADWRPADSIVLLLGQGVALDLAIPELAEAEEIEAHGREWAIARRRFESQWIYDTIPDSAAARLYGPAPRTSAREHAGRIAPVDARLLAAARGALDGWLSPGAADPEARASNVFAVGPRRSASGYPLLANDPHLSLSIPSPLQAIHVSVPGVVEAIGFCVPGLPTLVSGRNLRCAWGVTALSADVVDAYADTLSPDGRRVRGPGGWTPIRESSYDLGVGWRGFSLPVFWRHRRYTSHGPVLVEDQRRHIALSVRWAGLADSLLVTPLMGVERSRRATEVCAHFAALATPCLNLVAADADGRVLYQASGALPERGFDPGPGPLPGDGAHEWRGIVPHDRLPAWGAPPGGYVVNSNNRPVGSRYAEPLPRFDWAHDRALEIAGRLDRLPRVSLRDLAAIQNDIVSRGAARLLPLLLGCADSLPERWDPRMRAALDTLRRWDDRAARPLVAPTLYRGWVGALQRRSRLGGLTGLTAAALAGRAPGALLRPGAATPERPAEAAIAALALALDSLAAQLGPDLRTWTWARAHRAVFASTLTGERGAWEPAPIAVEGDNSTPCVGPSRLPWSTTVSFGPVCRHLVDLAVTDSSLGIIPPGDSGWHRGAHYVDQLDRWARHEYVPFYLSWDLIERAKDSETTLEPAP